MARYYAKGRAPFAKVHLVTGRGEEFVSNCGLVFRRNTKPHKELTMVRVMPGVRKPNGYEWGYPEVTCERCIQFGPPPFFQKKNFPSDKEQEDSGPEGVRRGQRGGMDVDL